jgi:hypothetical protein
VTSSFWFAFAALSVVQGALVLAPTRAPREDGDRLVGMLVPAGLLVVGVVLVQAVAHGAQALADLATFGTPVAAGLCGYLAGWRRAWLVPPAAAALYLVAWQGSGLVRDVAGVLLIAGACLSGAALLGRFVGARELTIGLVLLVVLDVVLVFGTSQVSQTTVTLHGLAPVVATSKPLPALQDVTLGSSMMGWLDLLAPALLGVILARSPGRFRAAPAVTVSALIWGTLLYATPFIPATVPVLVGLLAARLSERRRRSGPARSLRSRLHRSAELLARVDA